MDLVKKFIAIAHAFKIMLKHIHVVPLAAESLGVRSMCTYVETPDARILLDAGISVCPNRFGLPPHPKEFRAIAHLRGKIAKMAEKAEAVTLSHYHFDHHTPSYEDWLCNWTEARETARQIYEGKTVFLKNPKERINYSQRRRGWMFQRTAGKHAKKTEVADGKTFILGKTKIKFSEPVFHGSENSALGWILMTTVESEGERFMFAPDVQGPMQSPTLELIVKENPQLLIIGGPPLYLAEFRVRDELVQEGLKNLVRIARSIPCTIVDHHILRDIAWREKAKGIFEKAHESGNKVLTAAEFLGETDILLEAIRKELFIKHPPSEEFRRWMRENVMRRKKVRPPI